MSDNDSAPSASRRPEMTTFAPCSAKATAVALPIPEVPPVINATFSANDVFIVVRSFRNLNDYDVGAMLRHPSVLPSSRAHQNMGTRYGSDCDQGQRRRGGACLTPM